MLAVTVSGNLSAPPKEVFTNAAGKVFSIRFGCSTYKMENKQFISDTVWCSALVPEKKVKSILTRLHKGTFVVVHSGDATLKQYQANDGSTKCEMDLRFVSSVEAGNLPKEEPAPQQAQQYQPHQSQQQPPWQQPQAPQYQQQYPQAVTQQGATQQQGVSQNDGFPV